MACTRGSRSGEPARSQTLRYASIALSTAHRCVPSGAGPTTEACVGVRPAASGRRDQDSECPFRVGSHLSDQQAAVIRPGTGDVWCSSGRTTPRRGSRRRLCQLYRLQRPLAATADLRPTVSSVADTMSSRAAGHRPKSLQNDLWPSRWQRVSWVEARRSCQQSRRPHPSCRVMMQVVGLGRVACAGHHPPARLTR
jgi:hypothetical protein